MGAMVLGIVLDALVKVAPLGVAGPLVAMVVGLPFLMSRNKDAKMHYAETVVAGVIIGTLLWTADKWVPGIKTLIGA